MVRKCFVVCRAGIPAEGWNLLSLYIALTTSTVDVLFSGIKEQMNSVWVWKDNKWAVYLPQFSEEELTAYLTSKSFSQLTTISSGEGFWANTISPQTLATSGTQPGDTSHALATGWHLIGLKSNESRSIPEYVSGNGSKVDSVWKWVNNKWSVYLPGGGTEDYVASKGFLALSTIHPGEGFWINCSEAILLE